MMDADASGNFVNGMIAFSNMINSDDGWISDGQYATLDAGSEIVNYDFLSLGILS